MRILGIGAHPDDVEIFFFGTLAAAQAARAEIGWLIATDGSKGGRAPPAKLRATRRREAMAAAALLAVMPGFLGRVDGELAADTAAGGLIEAELRRRKPDLIITHAPNDYHPDHRALSRLVGEAARFRTPVVFADTLMGTGFEPAIWVERHGADGAQAAGDPLSRLAAAGALRRRHGDVEPVSRAAGERSDSYAEAFRFEPVYPFADIRALLPAAPPVRGL